ncbi:MAG: efflux RND transporter permease subunit [Treponema sp.]|jgi:multidrug efflux pump subunit AcrB|nr:efflux RND transporter permease subunit [Treponema sp.]
MKALVNFCAGRPVALTMTAAALLLAGVFSLFRLPLEQLPDLSVPAVTVETLYPGMGAGEIRSIVTIPIEDALSSVKGLERLRSVSRDGASLITMDFRWGTDPSAAAALVREAVDAVYPGLPEGIRKPVVLGGDGGAEPLCIIAVHSRGGDPGFARTLAEYELRSRLRKIDGVGQVILVGGETAEGELRLDLPAVLARGLGPAEFAGLLASETADIPAGSARDGDLELVVVSSGRPSTEEELTALSLPAGLRVSDAAEYRRGAARRKSLFINNGREETALEVYRRPGADPVRLSTAVRKMLDETIPLFSRDADIELVRDTSPLITEGIRSLGISSVLGAAAVIAALIFFLGRLRYGLLCTLSIPVSAAAGLAALTLGGKSLNSMSLGGLAVGIGLVSDTGVIVLDLLHRDFSGRTLPPPPSLIGACAVRVSVSCFTSTVTTAVVFIPVLFLPGPLGSLYGDLSIALLASVTAGWLYAQFVLPPLYRVSFKPGTVKNRTRGMERKYRALLRSALRRPLLLSAVAVLSVAPGFLLLTGRPAVFVSPEDARELSVRLDFPPGTTMERISAGGIAVSRLLSELSCIDAVFGRAGSEDEDLRRRTGMDYRKEELAFRCLLRKGVDSEAALAEVREKVDRMEKGGELEGLRAAVSFPQDRAEKLLGLSAASLWAVRGGDPEETKERAARCSARIAALTGPRLASLTARPSGSRPEFRIIPDRAAAAFLGVSTARVAEFLHAATEGLTASRLEIEGRPLEIRVRGKLPSGKDPLKTLEEFPFLSEQGALLPLGAFNKIEWREADAFLARLNRSDVIYLEALPAPGGGEMLSSVLKEMTAEMPFFFRAGESAFSRYRLSLLAVLALVTALLYITMGAQFESLLLPLIFMVTIPLSLAGTGPALFLAGANLDSGAVLGLVVLFGLVVNNGIVLYEIGSEKVHSGLSPVLAVYRGACERQRPVLITAATTVFALLPLTLSPLGLSQRSLALSMMGGMIASTLLTLFILPAVLLRYFRRRAVPAGRAPRE